MCSFFGNLFFMPGDSTYSGTFRHPFRIVCKCWLLNSSESIRLRCARTQTIEIVCPPLHHVPSLFLTACALLYAARTLFLSACANCSSITSAETLLVQQRARHASEPMPSLQHPVIPKPAQRRIDCVLDIGDRASAATETHTATD